MSKPKLHHYVPRFYLRGFADHNDRLAVRQRNGGAYVTSTKNVMARSGLYNVTSEPLTAEHTLGDIESMASSALQILRSGCLPSSTSTERKALTLYMGVQLSRNTDAFCLSEFVSRITNRFGSFQVEMSDMRSYLTEAYGFKPPEHEIKAARDMAYIFGTGPGSIDEMRAIEVKMIFDTLDAAASLLEARSWSLESSKTESLITSDRPIVLWNPPSPEDDYRGVGAGDAEEIWFPIDRSRILTLRRGGPEEIRRIGPERVAFVNQHIARHCTERIVSHPAMSDVLNGLDLAKRRPTLRFGSGPLVDRDSGRKLNDEILQAWRPIRDIPDGR